MTYIEGGRSSICVLENVPNWQSSISQHVVRATLAGWGYEIHENIIDHEVGGTLEHRKRFCMVAVTKGLDFNWASLVNAPKTENCLGDIMEDVPTDSPLWSANSYLFEKEKKDKAAGKGFRLQIVNASSPKCNTVPRAYWKKQSTNPMIEHPEGKALYRLFTPIEHCRIKKVPEELIEGLSATQAHQVLGQAVLHSAFVQVAKLIGSTLQAFVGAAALPQIPAEPAISEAGESGQLALWA